MRFTRLFLLLCLATPLSSFAESSPSVVLIPGSGSSGAKIHVANLNWGTKLLGGDRYFGLYLDHFAKRKIPAQVCPKEEDQDRRTLDERAEDCARVLTFAGNCTPDSKRSLILVGHSMGGLVARLLAQDPRVRDCVHSVITVSTPNRGTPLADVAVARSGKPSEPFDLFGKLIEFIRFQPKYLHYLPQLQVDRTTQPADLFRAQDVSDNPAVQYFSVVNSVSSTFIPPLELGRKLISDELKKRKLNGTPYGLSNDGIVPTYSMEHGTIIGTLDVHHWGTACMDPVRRLPECKRAKNLLMPFVEGLHDSIAGRSR
ncbi:MAG: hypothetical protein A2X94_00010 [Bdellovibrionales bacterium GWB1_55_8]|nr:MAG: hypothetical protein A2X94_00010 [Bdellovibrionales bacterium GWB1_55_8]